MMIVVIAVLQKPIASAPTLRLPYKVDTSRPSLRTNWTRLVPLQKPIAFAPTLRLLPSHLAGDAAPQVPLPPRSHLSFPGLS